MAQGSRQVIHMGPIECCNNTRIPSQTASEAQRKPNKDLKKQNQDFLKIFNNGIQGWVWWCMAHR